MKLNITRNATGLTFFAAALLAICFVRRQRQRPIDVQGQIHPATRNPLGSSGTPGRTTTHLTFDERSPICWSSATPTASHRFVAYVPSQQSGRTAPGVKARCSSLLEDHSALSIRFALRSWVRPSSLTANSRTDAKSKRPAQTQDVPVTVA